MFDHNHIIIICTRVLTLHALWVFLSLLGLLSDNPGLVCSRYLCLDHGAGTILEGSLHSRGASQPAGDHRLPVQFPKASTQLDSINHCQLSLVAHSCSLVRTIYVLLFIVI